LRIENHLDLHLQRQIRLRKLHPHQVALFDADAVFTGQATADFNTQLENVVTGDFCLLGFFGIIRIVKDQRMQIAIARMENVGNLQAMTGTDLRNLRALSSAVWLTRIVFGSNGLAMSTRRASRSLISTSDPSTSMISSASTSIG
jgi:hypothetical protein